MTTLLSRYRAARGEDGFSLPEVLVVTMLMGIVAATLMTTLNALTQTSASTNTKANILAEARLAMQNIARDLRAANPVDPISPSLATNTYNNKVTFKVFCSSGSDCVGGLRQVAYQFDPAARTLDMDRGSQSRALLEPRGPTSIPASMRQGAVVNTASEPVFTYLDRNGAVIPTSSVVGDGRPATYFRDCTKRVLIRLKVRSKTNDPTAVVDLTTSVQLRNYNEVNPC